MAAFDTPDNEQSFSGLVDQAIRITGRVSALPQAVGYANAAIRECQMLGLFVGDSVEETIVATADPHLYTPTILHRTVGTVLYESQNEYPRFLRPGRQQKDIDLFFYKVTDTYVFKGPIIGENIHILSYYYARRLGYYKRLNDNGNLTGGPYDTRPAYFDVNANEWLYLLDGAYVTTLGSEELDEAARTKSSNWLVNQWYDMILEAVKGKLWSAVADERGRGSYALYQSYKNDLQKATYEAENN